MAKKLTLLEQMKDNPKGDWKIGDIKKVCHDTGLTVTSPTRGSHYKVSSPYLDAHFTIPAKRPIKPIYIQEFANMIDAHRNKERRK